MITNEQILFRFDGYHFEKITFNLYDKPLKEEITIEGNIDVNIAYSKDLKSCTIKMLIDLFPDLNEGPFNLNAVIVGKFSFKDSLKKEQIESFIKFNGIGTLTPYLRSAITDITKAANVPPLVIPYINPMDFDLNEFTIDDNEF